MFTFVKNCNNRMDTLIIRSKSRSNAQLVSALARKLGDQVFENTEKTDKIAIHYASESVLAKDWLALEEDLAWKNL